MTAPPNGMLILAVGTPAWPQKPVRDDDDSPMRVLDARSHPAATSSLAVEVGLLQSHNHAPLALDA